jgi:branched-chain amino acid transport system permease protein
MQVTVVEDWIAIGIQVILVLSVNMVSGYARQLSLGQAAFAGIGAYTSALLVARLQVSFWLACPLSILLSAAVGAVLGAPVLRAVRYYVPVMTFTLNVLVFHLLRLGRLTGEPMGLGRIPRPMFFDGRLSPQAYLGLVAGAIACCLLVEWAFRRSAIGKSLSETADDREDHGLQPRRAAVYIALVISAAMAGLAGSLFAHFSGFISPFDFDIETSLFVLAVAAFGGLGFLPGVLLSVVGLGLVLEHFQDLMPYRFWFAGVVFLLASMGWPWFHQHPPRPTLLQPQDAEAK